MNFLTNPMFQGAAGMYIAQQLFSAIVQSLPNPSEYGGIWYKAFYNFLSILAVDFKSFAASQTGAKLQPPSVSAVNPTTSTGTSQGAD